MGLVFQVAASLALGSVPPERAGMASGTYSTFEQLGYAFGVAAFGTLAVSTMGRSLAGEVADPHGVARTLSGSGADTLLAAAPADRRASLDDTLHAVFATGHNTLALVAGAVTLAAAALVLVLTRRSGDEAPGAGETEQPPARHQTVGD